MTRHSIRIVMPFHLQTLASIGSEITLAVETPVTADSIVDAIESAYPMLRGTIRDHVTKKRRPLLRYFVCSRDISHLATDAPLPDEILNGTEPFIIWGAVAGG
ncbi:MAG: hypothetical protein U0892_13950 [Pirellulales bacterium]